MNPHLSSPATFLEDLANQAVEITPYVCPSPISPRLSENASIYVVGHSTTAPSTSLEADKANANSPVGDIEHRLEYSSEAQEESTPPIVITAPVPLPYAARSKAALWCMMAAGEDEQCTESTEVEYPSGNDAYIPSPAMYATNPSSGADFLGVHGVSEWFMEGIGYTSVDQNQSHVPTSSASNTYTRQDIQHQPTVQEPRMIIHPITTSTLLALTEPYLMAWCCDPDNDFISRELAKESRSGLAPISWPAVHVNRDEGEGEGTIQTFNAVNSWGY